MYRIIRKYKWIYIGVVAVFMASIGAGIRFADGGVSVNSAGVLSLESHVALVANSGEYVEAVSLQEELPIKNIYLDDGVRVEMLGSDLFVKTTEEILRYASEYEIEETKEWLVDELSKYLGGEYDVVINIEALEPLELEVAIRQNK